MAKVLRITEGRFKGFRLLAPSGEGTRPTSAKNREALFNILRHGKAGFDFAGSHVLDIYAGAGTLGFEALSRGAAHVIFLEKSEAAARAIKENARALGVETEVHILRRDARRAGKRASALPPASLLVADPPYGARNLGKILESLARGGWLSQEALIALEEDSFSEMDFSGEDFSLLQSHRSGRAHFRIWRRRG